MKTREEALADARSVLADAHAVFSKLSPLESAQRAYHPGGPPVDVLASKIAAARQRTAASPRRN